MTQLTCVHICRLDLCCGVMVGRLRVGSLRVHTVTGWGILTTACASCKSTLHDAVSCPCVRMATRLDPSEVVPQSFFCQRCLTFEEGLWETFGVGITTASFAHHPNACALASAAEPDSAPCDYCKRFAFPPHALTRHLFKTPTKCTFFCFSIVLLCVIMTVGTTHRVNVHRWQCPIISPTGYKFTKVKGSP